jgi:superfamily I DNA/RNA helicase
VDAINEIFANDVSGILVLSTIHKSKGREWNTVFWLDRAGTCPSKYARQAWQQEQEINLQYVAATRAKRSLVDLYAAPEGGQEFARENEEAGI